MAVSVSVPHVISGDDGLDRQLRLLVDAINELRESLLARPQLVEDIALVVSTEQTVYHGMGRVPRGFIVVKAGAAVDVHESSTADDTFNSINLTGNATATVSVLFF